MYLKQRDEVLDNRAKHNELQVKAGTVATAQVMLANSMKEHMSDCKTSITTRSMTNQCRRNMNRRTIRNSIQVCSVQTRLEMETTARTRRQRDIELNRDRNRQSHVDPGIAVWWTYREPGWEPSTKRIKE